MSVRGVSAFRARRCAQKTSYGSWAEAEEGALLLMEDLRDGKLPLKKEGNVMAYRCDVCGRWKIGHLPRPRNPFNYYRQFLNSRPMQLALLRARR